MREENIFAISLKYQYLQDRTKNSISLQSEEKKELSRKII